MRIHAVVAPTDRRTVLTAYARLRQLPFQLPRGHAAIHTHRKIFPKTMEIKQGG